MDYLKKKFEIHEVDNNLLNIVNIINNKYLLNIFKLNVLEVGIGVGHRTINFAKLFNNYYALEPDNDIYKICKENILKNNSNIKLFNIDFEKFFLENKIKFDLVILENVIHLIGYIKLISLLKKFNNNIFIIIKNPIPKPFNWGNKEFCIDSNKFNKIKWIKFKNYLDTIYENINNSSHLLQKIKTEHKYYYLLRLSNNINSYELNIDNIIIY